MLMVTEEKLRGLLEKLIYQTAVDHIADDIKVRDAYINLLIQKCKESS
jgi:hypothetical protein